MTLLEALKRDEGRRPKPYQDTRGVWTVGYGHNLTTGALSDAAMEQILRDDIQAVETACLALPIWKDLSDPRKGVLLNMAFNLGFAGLMNFRAMYVALESGDYEGAARGSPCKTNAGGCLDMSDLEFETNGVTTWLKRVVQIFDAINKVGLPLVLVGLGIVTYYGWISSPLLTGSNLEKHDQNMTRLLDNKDRLDAQVLETLVAMRTDMTRNSAAYRVRICSEIRDVTVRQRCLDA